MNTISENIAHFNPLHSSYAPIAPSAVAPSALSETKSSYHGLTARHKLNPLDHWNEIPIEPGEIVPFDSAESAWFWFIQAQAARNDGAQIVAGEGAFVRPCEPVDILRELERLHRNRRLLIDHLKVMRHYGVRLASPDPRQAKEQRAVTIWAEAMEVLGEALIAKKIVVPRNDWGGLSGL